MLHCTLECGGEKIYALHSLTYLIQLNLIQLEFNYKSLDSQVCI